MPKKHEDIEQFESEILKDLEEGNFKSVKNLQEEFDSAHEAAGNYMKRDNRINIRISSADLQMVRRIAAQEGLPYQTLLASVIHKFAAGRLVDLNTKR